MQNDQRIIDTFTKVLTGKQRNFPRHMWEDRQHAIFLLKYLIEQKLSWTDEDIKKNLNKNIFIKYKLTGLLTDVFESSTYMALNTVYPGRFQPWELKYTPKDFWNVETAVQATKWMIEEQLGWSDKEIKSELSLSTFEQFDLLGMIVRVFSGSPYKAINAAYPGRFKPWELNHVPKKFWTKETGIEATKWLFEEKLGWTHDDIKMKLNKYIFRQNGLWGMLLSCFSGSFHEAVQETYPGVFKPWELQRVAQNFWNEESAIEATRWLVDDKLGGARKTSASQLTLPVFTEYGLSGMMRKVYNNSPSRALEAAYPNGLK